MEEHETAGVDDEIDLLTGMDEEDSETAPVKIAPDKIPGVNEATRTGDIPWVTYMTPMWTKGGTHKGDIEGIPTLGSLHYDDSIIDDEDDADVEDNHDGIPDDEVYHPDSTSTSSV
jgi:hypothetical protein